MQNVLRHLLGTSLRSMSVLLNLIYAMLLAAASPWIVWRCIAQGRYRKGWPQKLLGQLPNRSSIQPESNSELPPCIWFHAVSVGELQVIRPLIDRAQRERPDVQIVITTSTDSGYELARSQYQTHIVSFAPLDFTWSIRAALDRVQPDLLVLAELELWPNWLRITSNRHIPIAIVNARLSARSLLGYRRISWLIAPILSRVAFIGAQSNTYRDRFLQLGCREDQLEVTGNIKFDGATPDRQHPDVLRRRELLSLPLAEDDSNSIVWLCGSTQAPEETICLDAMSRLLPKFPKLRMILVPRHAERFEEVAGLVKASGLPWVRRSQLREQPTGTDWRVFLADSIGELRWWWGLADIGFVGGSFGSRGGQNMIEPCAYGVATSFGPNTRNFADVVQLLLDSEGAVRLSEPAELEKWVARMIEHPADRFRLQSHATETVLAQRGAVECTWNRLQKLIPNPPALKGPGA
jgi:3-deoxy-D-manno-octulosonic-acid transferase